MFAACRCVHPHRLRQALSSRACLVMPDTYRILIRIASRKIGLTLIRIRATFPLEVQTVGCRTLELADGRAILTDSVTETVFGPIFADEDEATAFIAWMRDTYRTDPRGKTCAQLEGLRHAFLTETARPPTDPEPASVDAE
jgi:hypothetical protein